MHFLRRSALNYMKIHLLHLIISDEFFIMILRYSVIVNSKRTWITVFLDANEKEDKEIHAVFP